MHANLRQLLSLRDGAPVDALCREHVASCRHCQRELEQLQCLTRALRELPPTPAPDSAWAAIRARLHPQETASGASAVGNGASALAWLRRLLRGREDLGLRQALLEGMLASAVAVLAVVCLRVWSLQPEGLPRPGAAGTVAQRPQVSVAVPGYDQLLSRVRAQDAVLARLPAGRADDPRLAAQQQALKDRIALLDHYVLTEKNLSPEDEYAVMLQRVELMDQLLGAYDTPQAIPAGFQP